MIRRLFSELLGTFILVVAGCGAIVFNKVSGGSISHVGISLVFGLVVLAIVYMIGDVSGAHINPAVTVAFAFAGRFPWRDVPGYVLAQCAGATLGAAFLWSMFPDRGLGETTPQSLPWHSFALEIFLTFFLMLVVLQVSTGSKEVGVIAGIVVGSVIALEALFAGPICGASMNPARSLGPAVIAGELQHLWIYLTAPTLGAALAVPVWGFLRGPEKK